MRRRKSPEGKYRSKGHTTDQDCGLVNNTRNGSRKSPDRNEFDDSYLIPIVIVRAGCLIVWTTGILYSTYHVFKAAEEHLPFQSDPIMNPGPLADLLGRGRDVSDEEWVVFSEVLWTRILFAFALNKILARIFIHLTLSEMVPWVSFATSLMLFWNLVGLLGTLHLIFIPVIYWLLLRTKRRFMIWGATIAFIFLLNTSYVHRLFDGRTQQGWTACFYFVVTAAWNFAKCVSFCMDVWNRSDEEKFGFTSLKNLLHYIFYLPLSLTGPLVMYQHFEQQIILKQNSSMNAGSLIHLGKGLLKMLMITILNELVFHYLYFRPISLTVPVIHELNLWALCGTIYWLGQIFTLKYKVMYGIPSYLAEFDGLEMYPLPRCPAYIHRYSVLWKDFDRGLYYFMVRYIYTPVIQLLNEMDENQKINLEIKKLAASLVTFVYVYLWHSTAYSVFIWAAWNFIGITIEKIGSLLKKTINRVTVKTVVRSIEWDFIVEPIVTVPLAAMSILNSTVFCGSLEAAQAFLEKLWTTREANYNHLYIWCFMYCFTQVGVTVRTWDAFYDKVKAGYTSYVKTKKPL